MALHMAHFIVRIYSYSCWVNSLYLFSSIKYRFKTEYLIWHLMHYFWDIFLSFGALLYKSLPFAYLILGFSVAISRSNLSFFDWRTLLFVPFHLSIKLSEVGHTHIWLFVWTTGGLFKWTESYTQISFSSTVITQSHQWPLIWCQFVSDLTDKCSVHTHRIY